MLIVGLSKMLNPTLNTSHANIFAYNYQSSTLMTINHVLTVSWESKVGILPPCWDLLT